MMCFADFNAKCMVYCFYYNNINVSKKHNYALRKERNMHAYVTSGEINTYNALPTHVVCKTGNI